MTEIHASLQFRRGDFTLDAYLELPAGSFTALLGASGSGKSTLLRLLAGLEQAQQGYIRAGEALWFDAAGKVMLPAQRRRIGMVFQDYALFSHMSVAANIGYGVAPGQRQAVVARWLQRTGLEDYATAYPDQLSGGQRQRVALARALAHEPEVLLLDEPFSAQDPVLRRHLRRTLSELLEGLDTPVLMASHDLDEAFSLSDRLAVMAGGRLIQQGRLAEVLERPVSRRAAEVLGWQNFLPVMAREGDEVVGPWGRYSCPGGDLAPWLAGRGQHFFLADTGPAATVTAVCPHGPWPRLEVALGDGSRLVLVPAEENRLPEVGEKVCIGAKSDRLRLLGDL